MKRKYCFFILCFHCFTPLFAQLMSNNGVVLSIGSDTKVCIRKGGFLNNTNAIFQHAGFFLIEGDFKNEHIVENKDTAQLYILGNFVNNQVFEAGKSSVTLYGATQSIGGNSETDFYNLNLSGSGIKRLEVNATVLQTLQLNDLEMATDSFLLEIRNPATNAINRKKGFVSSLNNGALLRKTNQSKDYLFPVGSSLNAERYRPIVINPSDINSNIFAVRLVNQSASKDGFSTKTLDKNTLELINPLYYHQIAQTKGNTAATISFYPVSSDGSWNTIAYWDKEWKNTANVTATSNVLEVPNWKKFDYRNYALAQHSENYAYIPNSFSPNEDGINDYFQVFGTDKVKVVKKMQIFDRWGNLVFDKENLDPNVMTNFWDGTYQGKALDSNVFTYFITLLLTDGKNKVYHGDITIIK